MDAGDEEKLIKDFFRSISYDVKDEIGLFFQKYGRAISFSTQHIIDALFPDWPQFIKSPGEKAAQVLNDLKEIFTEDNVPLYIRKKELCEKIKKEHIHLLVFIDDLDRLDKNEVHAVFRLIRQVADFPNTIYMIAMDPEVVSRSLCEFYGKNKEDGSAFIDKIIQVPINLPQISNKKITSDVTDLLHSILLNDGEPENEINETESLISELLTTPRQLIRFKNQISFKLSALKGEINLCDLCKLEAINIVSPATYNKLYENRSKLFKEADLLNSTFDKDKEDKAVAARFDEAIKTITDEVPANIKQSCHNIITSLFSHTGVDSFSIISRKRVQSPIFFYRYFLQGVPDEDISEKEIAEFQNDIDTKTESELTNRINEIVEKYNFDNFSRAIQVILYRNRGEEINLQRISRFCISFCQSKDCVSCDEYIDDKLNYASALVFNVINNYMRTTKDDSSFDYHPEETAALLTQIYKKSTITSSMNLLRFMYNRLNFYSSLPADHILPLIESYCKLAYKDQYKFPLSSIRNFFSEWKRYDDNGPKEYLKHAVASESFEGTRLLCAYVSGEKFGSANAPDIKDFVCIFEDTTELFLDKLQGSTLGELEQKAYDLLEHNWRYYLPEK